MPSPGRFAFYWASRDVAALGNGIFIVGILAWSYHLEESATLVSVVLLALILPPFLLSPLADHLVSRRIAYPVAIASQLAAILALLPLLGAGSNPDLRLVLVMSFTLALLTAFIKASRRVLLPAFIGEKVVTAQKALVTTRLVTMIAGPAAGTIIYSSSNYGSTGFSSCVTGAMVAISLSTALLLFARPVGATWPSFDSRSLVKQLAELQKGLVYCWQRPELRSVATIQLLAALLIGGLVVVQVALMVWGAFTSADSLGFVLAAQGVGIALVALGNRYLLGQLLPYSRVATGFGLIAVGCFGFAITGSLKGSVASGLVVGLGLGLSGLALTSLISKLATEEVARPVWRGLDLAISAAVILSAAFFGRITDLFGPRYTIIVVAILLAVLALYAFGAVPDPDTRKGDSDITHPVADTLYHDVGSGVPTGTPLG